MAKVRKRTWTNSKGEQTAWIADYTDQDGRRHIKTFETKKAATAWLVNAQGEVARGTHTPERSSITIAEASRLWLKRCEVEGLERASVAAYRCAADLHIVPRIGDVRLAKLTTPTVESFKDELLERLSRNRAGYVLAALKSILSDAMRRGLVAQNTARDVTVAAHRRHKERVEIGIQIPSKADINAIISAANSRRRPLVVTAAFTGMRTSELRGLTWNDVDLVDRMIHVRRRVDAYGKMGSPKSAAGRRDIPMSPAVVNALREWKLACPKGPMALVFPNSAGKVETHQNLVNRFWRPLLRKLEMVDEADEPRFDFHSLRHFAASLLIESAMSPKRVQAILGHGTLAMNFDRYGHLFPSLDDDHARLAAAERGVGLATYGRDSAT